MMIRRFLGVAVLLTLGGFASASEQANGTLQLSDKGVSGMVVGTSGGAIAGAVISLNKLNSETPAAKAISGSDGTFTLSAVPAGAYRLDVGGRMAMDVEVTANATFDKLRILYPESGLAGAAEAGATASTWIPLAVGGAVGVVAVTVSVVAVTETDHTSP